MKKNNPYSSLKFTFIALAILVLHVCSFSQILTSSPYSRYGLGELNLQTFAAPSAMGGSFIAYHQDTVAPFFINVANPAGLASLKLSVFEVGGQAQFTKISSQSSSVNKNNSNFSYASVGFPLKRFGGAAFGVMPYSTVGYKITSTQEEANIGSMKYIFQGDGGINKAFIGVGIKPFKNQISKFQNSAFADSLIQYKKTSTFNRKKFAKQLLSELSIGATGNYLFGTINQTTDGIYPGTTTYFNTKRQRSTQISDFGFNAGFQTHFTIDSVKSNGTNRLLKQKIKIGIGFFATNPSHLSARQSSIIYNYAVDGFGIERAKDTILNSQDNSGKITLPLEMGAGISVKKGESLTLLLDAASTNWSGYTFFDSPSKTFKNSYRVSAGMNYVPNKLAYGNSNYHKRIQYRLGFSYSDGYLDLKNTPISNYFISAGLGLPVGIGRFDDIAIINLSAQFGKMGTLNNQLLQEQYVRLVVGFTFNKRWFIKYKYD